MRNDSDKTPLRKLIAPPKRALRIVLVISNREDMTRSLFYETSLSSLFFSSSSLYKEQSSLSLSFSLREYACRSLPLDLFAREIFLRVVPRKRILTTSLRIKSNYVERGKTFALSVAADFYIP